MAMERLWEKMEEEEGKICGRKKKGLREKEEEIPNSVLPKENRIFFSVLLWCRYGCGSERNGSKTGGTEIFFRSPFEASKGTEKKFRFPLNFDFMDRQCLFN